jgi:hypothetical protein
MKTSNKIIATIVAMFVGYCAVRVLAPVAAIASNKVIVAQVQNSDAASLALSGVGTGYQSLVAIVTIMVLIVLYFIWKKSK